MIDFKLKQRLQTVISINGNEANEFEIKGSVERKNNSLQFSISVGGQTVPLLTLSQAELCEYFPINPNSWVRLAKVPEISNASYVQSLEKLKRDYQDCPEKLNQKWIAEKIAELGGN